MANKLLFDTNILIRSLYPDSPEQKFLLSVLKSGSAVVSVLTIAECLSGADQEDEAKFEILFSRLPILEVTEAIAREAGRLRKQSLKKSKVYLVDCCLAATAKIHGLTLVTHNTSDFHFPSLQVFTP